MSKTHCTTSPLKTNIYFSKSTLPNLDLCQSMYCCLKECIYPNEYPEPRFKTLTLGKLTSTVYKLSRDAYGTVDRSESVLITPYSTNQNHHLQLHLYHCAHCVFYF